MGDVVVKLPVRSSQRARAIPIPLYFDSGSPRTFVRQETADRLGYEMELPEPAVFHGLGNGEFSARTMIALHIRIKGVWCLWPTFVVPNDALHEAILIGHDFMQEFNIRLDPRGRRIIVDKRDLERACYVRRAAEEA